MSTTIIAAIAALLAGGAVFLIVYGLSLPQRAALIQARLGQYRPEPRTLQEIELQAPLSERLIKPAIEQMSRLVQRVSPGNSMEKTREMLLQAGNPSNLTVPDFMGLKGLLAVVLGGLTVLLVTLTKQSIPYMFLLTMGLAGLGFMMPGIWLRGKIKKRRKAITNAMPDCIDLLTISVEAGLGFDAALQRVCDKSSNALTDEFGRALAEVRMGNSRRQALHNLIDRTGVQDLTAFATAIIQAEQLGVSVSKVLRVQSEEMRRKRRVRAEEIAHKAPIKMLFPMVFFIFPPMFILILGPAIPQAMKLAGTGL